MKSALYIVATPIGNLKDITLRALEILEQVDWIAAEDTRHSSNLLRHYGITKPLKSFHSFNENERSQLIQDALDQGQSVALISDAGTPLISDPGYKLVYALTQKNYSVISVPGACALITALVGSGLPTDQFLFSGFLSAKSNVRKEQLINRIHEPATQIFYESPHRLLGCLEDMLEIYGEERMAVIGRELTKTYEDWQRGSLMQLLNHYKNFSTEQRGEFVILLSGSEKILTAPMEEVQRILKILLKTLPLKEASNIAAQITGWRKNELYEIGLTLK